MKHLALVRINRPTSISVSVFPFYRLFHLFQAFVDQCLSLSNGDLESGPLSFLTMMPKIRGLLTAVSEVQ